MSSWTCKVDTRAFINDLEISRLKPRLHKIGVEFVKPVGDPTFKTLPYLELRCPGAYDKYFEEDVIALINDEVPRLKARRRVS